jgi:hypothetical protein
MLWSDTAFNMAVAFCSRKTFGTVGAVEQVRKYDTFVNIP